MSQFAEMKSGAEMRDHVIGKAADDAEFRTRLVADPKAALNDEFGVSLPDSFDISVHEDSSTHVNLVLPPTEKLDSAVLEEISGGEPHGGSDCWVHSAPAGGGGSI